ncbi:3-methyladenine DNA glycosylase [Gulosibacter massiliensis]|uniref:3-methyladenine DNA glycosylase n=1 Tax=Gulosibacter massiliensis TaxID=2479839 RepID=UPI000F62DF60|nr:3-methyladenine DNA glycosylase [Gulosibacter massiliensis]
MLQTTWQAREAAHRERADALTSDYRAARDAGRKHAIDDFLFTYYSYKPAVLRRWHPGIGVALEGADAFAERRWYRQDASGRVEVDAAAFLAAKGDLVERIRALTASIAGRDGQFGCFGLHEWAMVYRDDEHRHPIPLRLGQRGTDAVVESHRITCSHYDAYRFFTPDARPRNLLEPTRERQCELDQPGCLHANMDVYKWCVKLGPLVPGELLLDAFALAKEIRWLDMAASPYDVRDYGVDPVEIETPAGKAEYVRQQRAFAARSQQLRARLLEVIGLFGHSVGVGLAG